MTPPDPAAEAPRLPDAVELDLDGVGVVRGLLWPASGRAVLFLHAPGDDLDAWRDLPAAVSGATGFASLALDLPGCGMSDDPARAWSLAGLLAAAGNTLGLPPSRCVVAALGQTALDILALDPA
ncbi:MAG: alpha/beta fold hydrolase, partial [Chloroflexota bacterium]